MRAVMLGTGPFAVPSLCALHASQHEVVLVVSRPPRGRRVVLSPVQAVAEDLRIETWLPDSVNSDPARARLASLKPDLLVVCDYGEILKSTTLGVTRLGGINLHGSLLPKYRGAAPVQWAILSGDEVTGNTVIQMTPGLDAGPCLGFQQIPIDPDETAGELESRMAQLGADLVLEVVDQLETGTTKPTLQDTSQSTKAPRLSKTDGAIQWSQTARQIKNQVRGLQPWPRAYTNWYRADHDPQRLILHRVSVDAGILPPVSATPGTVVSVEPNVLIATGNELLRLEMLQPAGKRVMKAAEFLRGNALRVGDRLGPDRADLV